MPSSDCNGHQAPTEAKGINAGKTSTYIIKLKIKREEKRELITFCEGQKKKYIPFNYVFNTRFKIRFFKIGLPHKILFPSQTNMPFLYLLTNIKKIM